MSYVLCRNVSAPTPFSCSCCGEKVRKLETCSFVLNPETGKGVRQGRYCPDCDRNGYPHDEFDDARGLIVFDHIPSDQECQEVVMVNKIWDEEAGLRSREDFVSYQAAGCPSEYFEDRDAGYAD